MRQWVESFIYIVLAPEVSIINVSKTVHNISSNGWDGARCILSSSSSENVIIQKHCAVFTGFESIMSETTI